MTKKLPLQHTIKANPCCASLLLEPDLVHVAELGLVFKFAINPLFGHVFVLDVRAQTVNLGRICKHKCLKFVLAKRQLGFF